MIAIAQKSQVRTRGWQRRFLRLLPQIRRRAQHAFRRLNEEQREEAVADVIANTLAAYRRLVELGKEEMAYATVLARFAVAQYRSGRRVGSRKKSRDVLSPARRRCDGNEVVSLESLYGEQAGFVNALIDHRQTSIPDQAAFRIDFNTWLRRLRPRDRRLVKFLTLGNSPSEAADELHVSRGRISQLRDELHADWSAFHGEAAIAASAAS